ncbi:MAG: hypothetical protein LUH56_02975 [Oscillospiraceae bacterium]|nr:hypothetical protein [Oscillospiraceae bacterium]
MKKIYRLFLLLCIVCLFASLLTGCRSSLSLIGAWTPAGCDYAPYGYPDYLILEKDGSCNIEGGTGVWSVDSGILTIRASNGLYSVVCRYNYEINGSELTLVDVDDNSDDAVVYERN